MLVQVRTDSGRFQDSLSSTCWSKFGLIGCPPLDSNGKALARNPTGKLPPYLVFPSSGRLEVQSWPLLLLRPPRVILESSLMPIGVREFMALKASLLEASNSYHWPPRREFHEFVDHSQPLTSFLENISPCFALFLSSQMNSSAPATQARTHQSKSREYTH